MYYNSNVCLFNYFLICTYITIPSQFKLVEADQFLPVVLTHLGILFFTTSTDSKSVPLNRDFTLGKRKYMVPNQTNIEDVSA